MTDEKNNDGNNKEHWATVILRSSGKFLESLKMGKEKQTRYRLIPTDRLNDSTRAGIVDMRLGRIKDGQTVGAPIVRFDNPHKGPGVSQFPHINIDANGRPSSSHPHIRVPATLIACADKLDKCLKVVSDALFIVALVTDGMRICAAIYEDTTSNANHVLPHQTIKTIVSIAGGWSGAAAGATGGALLGAKIGACVGLYFGGVGAVIGAPIGAIIGGFTGALAGGLLGSYLAEQFVDAGLDPFEKGIKMAVHDWENFFNPFFGSRAIGLTTKPEINKTLNAAIAGGTTGGYLGSIVGPGGALVGGAVGAGLGAVASLFY